MDENQTQELSERIRSCLATIRSSQDTLYHVRLVTEAESELRSLVSENLTELPPQILEEVAVLSDFSISYTYYLEDDPYYDVGHDEETFDFSWFRKVVGEELQRREV